MHRKRVQFSVDKKVMFAPYVVNNLPKVKIGALVKWLREETRNQKVVSLNPGAGYWMDIFSHLFVVRIVLFV